MKGFMVQGAGFVFHTVSIIGPEILITWIIKVSDGKNTGLTPPYTLPGTLSLWRGAGGSGGGGGGGGGGGAGGRGRGGPWPFWW